MQHKVSRRPALGNFANIGQEMWKERVKIILRPYVKCHCHLADFPKLMHVRQTVCMELVYWISRKLVYMNFTKICVLNFTKIDVPNFTKIGVLNFTKIGMLNFMKIPTNGSVPNIGRQTHGRTYSPHKAFPFLLHKTHRTVRNEEE